MRLADEHVRHQRRERYELAEEGSDAAGADPGAVDEEAARHDEIFGAGLETGRRPLGGDHRRVLAHVGTEPSREPRVSRPDEARVRLPVLGRERGADHRLAEPGQLGPGRVRAEELQPQPVFGGVAGIALELRHVGLGAGELDMPGGLELDILADASRASDPTAGAPGAPAAARRDGDPAGARRRS